MGWINYCIPRGPDAIGSICNNKRCKNTNPALNCMLNPTCRSKHILSRFFLSPGTSAGTLPSYRNAISKSMLNVRAKACVEGLTRCLFRFPCEIMSFVVNRISLLLISRRIEPRTKRTKQRLPEPSLVLAQSRVELQLLVWQPHLDIVVEDLAHPASELFG